MSQLRLYHYWRSSSSWRVRWGLAIKGVQYQAIAVDLLDDSADRPEHRARNPLGFVPVLELPNEGQASDGQPTLLTESVAILEWLEDTYDGPSFFPTQGLSPAAAALTRARARQLAEIINSATQPLQNLNATEAHSPDPAEKKRWMQRWIREGLEAYEFWANRTAGRYTLGDQLSFPDLFLIPQVYNALRQEVSLVSYPTVQRIYNNCGGTVDLGVDLSRAAPGFAEAHPIRFEPKKT